MKRRVIRASTSSQYSDEVCNKLQNWLSKRGASEVTSIYGVGDQEYLNICVEVNISGYRGSLYCIFSEGEPYVTLDPVRPSGDVMDISVFREYISAASRLTEIWTATAIGFRSALQ